MTSQCRRTSIVVLLTVGLSAGLPSAAVAGSLLSGYGGPGQGNQAILGSALLNGPSGGGGGGGAAVATGTAAGAGATGAQGGSVAGRSASKVRAAGRRPTGRTGKTSTAGSQAYANRSPLSAAQTSGAGSSTLGLSGTDLAYIILALGALAVTGALTRQLTHRPQ